eukprot:CAMPEP_0170514320 /NCGR_PEP_ID=MMETSP0209-20121228/878_1 /TAXON_ID=665100 ORGANISM="Litonotus pictus, Strain P1" /NCGR_SAMPLE_ID=MMETSP0209 /ASSEMBLY_ACC=CAM_ASM_000301 /LENGTH=426 /DNA_ID=CAMNT_0010798359 /DNA_START=567 /DNA_END=1847 /DNA_ORIENTATION=-
MQGSVDHHGYGQEAHTQNIVKHQYQEEGDDFYDQLLVKYKTENEVTQTKKEEKAKIKEQKRRQYEERKQFLLEKEKYQESKTKTASGKRLINVHNTQTKKDSTLSLQVGQEEVLEDKPADQNVVFFDLLNRIQKKKKTVKEEKEHIAEKVDIESQMKEEHAQEEAEEKPRKKLVRKILSKKAEREKVKEKEPFKKPEEPKEPVEQNNELIQTEKRIDESNQEKIERNTIELKLTTSIVPQKQSSPSQPSDIKVKSKHIEKVEETEKGMIKREGPNFLLSELSEKAIKTEAKVQSASSPVQGMLSPLGKAKGLLPEHSASLPLQPILKSGNIEKTVPHAPIMKAITDNKGAEYESKLNQQTVLANIVSPPRALDNNQKLRRLEINSNSSSDRKNSEEEEREERKDKVSPFNQTKIKYRKKRNFFCCF